MGRFSLHWQNGPTHGICIDPYPGIGGSGAYGQVKEAYFWERKYRVIDLNGREYWLNRGSLIDRINQFSKTKLVKGYCWDYLGWFEGAKDLEIKTRLEIILRREAKRSPITAKPKDTQCLLFRHITNLQTLGRMSCLSHTWRKLTADYGWESIREKLTIPFSYPYQIGNYLSEMTKLVPKLFSDIEIEGAYLLLKSWEIGALNRFEVCRKAISVWTIWNKLQNAIKKPPQNFHGDYNEVKDAFSEWCKLYQDELQKLEKLDLRRAGLSYLPPEIGLLTGLKELCLLGNKLSSLPPEIGNLSRLEELYLDGNRLASLPREIGKLTQLQDLRLSVNELTQLPTELGNLSQLRGLYLSQNRLTSLPPELKNLPQLENLNLTYNSSLSLCDRISFSRG